MIIPCRRTMSRDDNEHIASNSEASAIMSYRPPGAYIEREAVEWMRNPDGTVLLDHKNRPLSVDKILATKPLRQEISTRPGPGGKKLSYMSGEGITRTLNDVFGYKGWNLDIKTTKQENCAKDEKGRYVVAYTAIVRLTHRKSGAYKEDCGAGDATDRNMGLAIANALKGSVTDAMKRAARHFGDKLGNSLYQGDFSVKKAPASLAQALDQYEIERANSKFGFRKDKNTADANATVTESTNVKPALPNQTTQAGKAISGSLTSRSAPTLVRNNSVPANVNQNPSYPDHQQRETRLLGSPDRRSSTQARISPQQQQQQQQQQQLTRSRTSYSAVQIKPMHPKPPPNHPKYPVSTPNHPAGRNFAVHSGQNEIPEVTPTSASERIQPPPTPVDCLKGSSLFGLSKFVAGNRPEENVLPKQFEYPRPSTSRGRVSIEGTTTCAGAKRAGVFITSVEPPEKKSHNPYSTSRTSC